MELTPVTFALVTAGLALWVVGLTAALIGGARLIDRATHGDRSQPRQPHRCAYCADR